IPGYGWATFDPTPADPNDSRLSILSKFDLYLDAAATYWREWVVDYDPRRQGSLADRLQQHAGRFGWHWASAAWFSAADGPAAFTPGLKRLVLALAVGLALVLIIVLCAPQM